MCLKRDKWNEILEKNGPIPKTMLDFIPTLVSEIELEIESDYNTLTPEMHNEITEFILRLPSSFDDGRLTLVVFYTNRLKMVNLDKICRIIAK